mgnify:CR=1 FL=1
MQEIRGDAKNILALLGNAKYAIDYYQREYRWQTKQVLELLDDLGDKFRESFEPAQLGNLSSKNLTRPTWIPGKTGARVMVEKECTIKTLHRQGEPVASIARSVGVSRQTVYAMLAR